jgi:hypothetical protein
MQRLRGIYKPVKIIPFTTKTNSSTSPVQRRHYQKPRHRKDNMNDAGSGSDDANAASAMGSTSYLKLQLSMVRYWVLSSDLVQRTHFKTRAKSAKANRKGLVPAPE